MDQKEKFKTDARASLVWGEDLATVKQKLEFSGLFSSREIDDFIKEVKAEMRATARSDGFDELKIGVPIFVVAAGFILVCVFGMGVYFTKLFALVGLAGIFGLYKTFNGAMKVISGQD